MQSHIFFRLRGPNIIGSAFFAFTGLLINLRQHNPFEWTGAIFIILSMIFFNIFIWVVNDYFDAPYDAEHSIKGARNVFCEGTNSRNYKIGFTVMVFSLIAGLISGGLAGPFYFLFAAAGMVLAYLYSSPVFRAKSRLFFDWFFHVVWFQITFLPLYLYIFGFNVIWGLEIQHIQFYAIFVFISMFSLLGQINHQIPDYSVDLQTQQRTTVVVLGIETTKKIRYLAYLLIVAATIVLCLLNSTILALIMMVIYTLYALKTNTKMAEDSPLAWLYFFLADYLVITPFLSFVIVFFF
ncbi:MAG: UbiA family prenyltransferase [Promethearchaeota archaeon]